MLPKKPTSVNVWDDKKFRRLDVVKMSCSIGQIAPKGQQRVAGGERYSANPRFASPNKYRPQRGRTNRDIVAPRWGADVFWFRVRGFGEYASPPATLCATVGGKLLTKFYHTLYFCTIILILNFARSWNIINST